jgi:Fe-S cluster assembly iron-binding protein IscA
MISVTEEAKRIVHAVAASAGLPEGLALRLETVKRPSSTGSEPQIAMVIDEPKEGDEAVEHQGEPLLYVSRKVSAACDGCVVDLEQTPKGIAFSIEPPEAGKNAR